METRLWERLRRVPAPVVDAGLAVAVVVVNVIAIGVATEPGSRPLNPLAYALAASYGVLLLARRRWPLGVLLASTAALFLYYSLDYPGVSPAFPLAVALYTAAVAGYFRWGLLVTAFFMTAGVFVTGVREGTPPAEVFAGFLPQASLLVTLLLLGEAVRSRQAWLAEVRERLARAEVEREREAARRVEQERLRIARELHDVMAHTISVITVQAGVAADVLADAPDEARQALGTIRAASREAMAELRATVGVLRGGDGQSAPLAPTPGLSQLDGLLEAARRGGLRVETVVAGDPRPLPPAVDLTAYRILQESLTNVARHAQATTARVAVRYQPDSVVIEVCDDGRGAAGAPAAVQRGHGLAGMAERAAAVGGRLEVGPRPAGGFRVWSSLPAERGV
ncbi:MAG TPA: sensor histidine kinase [Actinomycetes bacterium]|jgi:signal transduction histidine kinase|nr:sensor histidine kinase [Actinomycetes bacterium]